MSVTFDLLAEGHIIKITISDPFRESDMAAAAERANRMSEEVPYTIHVILDSTHLHSIPANPLRARRYINTASSKRGYIAWVGTSDLIRTLAAIIFRLVNYTQVGFFDTVDEAIKFLREVMSNETEIIERPEYDQRKLRGE
jgi:hypothetical protein